MFLERVHRGFTLIELIITIVVVAILVSIALPNFATFIKRNAVTAQSNDIRASLQYARSEAVSRHVRTTFCASTDGSDCAGSSTPLDSGWIVKSDDVPAPAGTGTVTEVMQVTDDVSNRVSIRLASASSASSAVLVFDPRGALDSASTLDFRVCAKDSGATLGASTVQVPGRRIVIAASGRVSIQPLAAGADCG